MLAEKSVLQLSEIIYTNIEGGTVPWSKLDQAAKDEQIKKTTAIIEAMGKLNLEILPRAEIAKMKGNPVDPAAFKLYCENFMKEVDPRNLISKLFPMDELKARLIRDFDVRVKP